MFYQKSEYEEKLLSSVIDTSQLCMLQRKSLTRLQFFLFNKKNFIRSTNDQFKQLRIIILTLLIKIYSEQSSQNQQRLNQLKNIVYSSNLKQLIKDKGLQKQQLHKLVAIQFSKMMIGFEAQSYLLNMFNCVAFFDQILLRSVQQKLSLQNFNERSLQLIEKYFKQIFKLEILWNSDNVDNETNNEIFLWKQNDNILRESSLNMTFIGESSSQESSKKSNQQNSKKRKKSKSKVTMLQTISVNESLSPKQFDSPRKQRALRFQNENISGFQNQNYGFNKTNKKNIDNLNQLNPEIHKIKRPDQKKRTFWDILCCSSQQK